MIDLKGLLKLEQYKGEKEKFIQWKWQLYVAVRVVKPKLLTKFEQIERNLNKDCSLANLSEEDRLLAEEAYTIFALTCVEAAADYIQTAEQGNGLETWCLICRARLTKSHTAMLTQLMEPKFHSSDARINLRIWQKAARYYASRTGERVPEAVKRTVYLNKIAPEAMKQHLLLNQTRLETSEDVANEIEEYCDAMQDMNESIGNPGIVAGANVITKDKHRDKGKGKGKKGEKGKGKRYYGKGKYSKGKQGKGEGKAEGKGKTEDSKTSEHTSEAVKNPEATQWK